MKIGMDARYAEGKLTGIGQYIHKLVLGLSQKKIKVLLFYSKNPLCPLSSKNIHPIILPSDNRYIFEQVLLPRSLGKEKVDLYHAAGNLGVPLLCPCPSVLTVHDLIPLLYKDYFSFSKFKYLSKASYFLRTVSSIVKANKIITDSEFTKNCLIKMFKVPCKKIQVINLGIKEIKKKTKLPKGVTKNGYILNCGGIDIRKNLERQIEAFAKISPLFPKLKLVITGENRFLKPKLVAFARKLKIDSKVDFPGYLDEATLWTLGRNASCICAPSEIEGFGFPVLQGFAGGVPVVAANSSSIPEIAGNSAILVDPYNVLDIARGIKKVLIDNHLRIKLIQRGAKQLKKFSWERTINETIEIYKGVIGDNE